MLWFNILECPCGGDCTAGCEGCENPICKPSKSVLMLSTYKSTNVPMVIDIEGTVKVNTLLRYYNIINYILVIL